ncbi:MAG: hypothetical protein Udaeo2_02520 [Candidatus Udaeobacter sp.]|nr:MAG: hypothetical protein Udaeo2_02520 [Candidatus Udaeobacter sp.]
MKKTNWTILHNKLSPTQRVGLVRLTSLRRLQTAVTTGWIVQLSFFFLRRSFFACSRCHWPPAAVNDRGYNE